MTEAGGPVSRRRAGPGISERLRSLGVIWLLLAGYSFLRVPVPGVNEPHYLGKAKAFWNPAWCAGDLFLESSSPHQAFYLTIGWLTRLFTLEETAIVGRCAALAVVAWGWRHFTEALGFRLRAAVGALSVLLLLQSWGSWSGEWLVGGVESKVFAYGLVFAGLGAVVAGRATPAAIWLGLATTMHPLVGGWATITVFLAALLRRFSPGRSDLPATASIPFRQRAAILLWWFVAAAPGIGWALPAMRGSPELARQADFIQVGYRLAHHLDPWTFAAGNHRYFVILIGLWQILNGRRGWTDVRRPFNVIVAVSLLIGLVSVGLSYGPRPWPLPLSDLAGWQLKLLKFYPFRLADLLIMVAVALSAVEFWRTRAVAIPAASFVLTAAACVAAIRVPNLDQNPSRMSAAKRRDWRAAMQWLQLHTAKDSLVLGANEDWALKWYAERPEYSNYKDCPQDPPSLVEWNNRLRKFAAWTQQAFADDGVLSASELTVLHDQTGIDYLICGRLGPFSATPVYENGSFRIYATVPSAGEPASP